MANLLTVLVAALFGMLGGATVGHLMLDYTSTPIEKAVGGAFAGSLCGVLGGSLGGDLTGQPDRNGNRNLYAVLVGLLAGAFGGAQSEVFVMVASTLSRVLSR